MKAKKVIISLLLLLTYSLGFAHHLIPHHHDAESKEHIVVHGDHHHHHHHGHESVEHSNSDHQHISHGDHYDEDLYDLLVCFLHKTDHEEDDCKDKHFLPVESSNVILNKLQANKLVAVLFSIATILEKNELFSDQHVNLQKTYLSPSIEDIPLRGPPSYS